MAIVKNGVNGTVSGKAGSVVFVSTKTGNYVRSLPRVKKREPSPEQLLSRKRFKMVRSHISQLKPIINMGYKAYSYPKRAYDVAMSYNLKEALIQEENGFLIDWQKFMIAKGSPNPITSYTMDFDQENQVFLVTWEYDPYLEKKFDMGTYDSFLFLYNATYNGAEYPYFYCLLNLLPIVRSLYRCWRLLVWRMPNRRRYLVQVRSSSCLFEGRCMLISFP